MSMVGIQRTSDGPKLVATLTEQDQCDRCPAAAQAVIILNTKPPVNHILIMCNHHTNEHEPKLTELGASIYRKDK